jgi:hypothetical protein
VCGCPDQVSAAVGELDKLGNQRIEHRVTIELRYLKSQDECTAARRAHGWRYKLHQARHAMERFLCRPCLIATQEMSKEFGSKREKELGKQNADPYYLALCGE